MLGDVPRVPSDDYHVMLGVTIGMYIHRYLSFQVHYYYYYHEQAGARRATTGGEALETGLLRPPSKRAAIVQTSAHATSHCPH